MDNKTIQYKRTLRGSVGAGVNALFNGNGRRYYILEHKDASKYHKAGESQKIIIDEVELGRAGNCQVRFDESFPTVSRRHAAIIKDGDRWKLVQLSKTNSTFLNGRPIENEWYLENGDEIQLSIGGPRLGFIVPAGKQSLVSSIKMTERLELFRKQALAPYKRAIAAMAVLIVLLSCGGGYKLYDLHVQNRILEDNQKALALTNDTLQQNIKEQAIQIGKDKETISKLTSELKSIKKQFNNIKNPPVVRNVDQYSRDVYFIGLLGYSISKDGESAIVETGDSLFGEKIPFCSGTGFILSDGTLVTARHVIEPWFFDKSSIGVMLNHLSCDGFTVVAHFFAISSTGATLKFSTENFNVNRSHDKIRDVEISEGKALKLRLVSTDYTDYASYPGAGSGSLEFDPELSKNLKVGEKLKILGFPLGLGASSKAVTPIYSTAEVAKDGLTDDGYILTTATGFEHGNSGGPVFVERDGKMIVVGIVSAGAGRSTGFVVPISVVK